MTPTRLEHLADLAEEAAAYAEAGCATRWVQAMVDAAATARAMADQDRTELRTATMVICCVCDQKTASYESNVAVDPDREPQSVFHTCHACLGGRRQTMVGESDGGVRRIDP